MKNPYAAIFVCFIFLGACTQENKNTFEDIKIKNNYLLKFNRKGDLIKIYETDRRFLCMAITPDDHDLYTVILNDKQEAIIARTNLD